jgi:hypothetical protein
MNYGHVFVPHSYVDVLRLCMIHCIEDMCYELAPHIPEDSMDPYGPTWTLEVT